MRWILIVGIGLGVALACGCGENEDVNQDAGSVDAGGDTCSNGLFDPETGETDTDCGGNCKSCDFMQNCRADTDCETGYCGSSVSFAWCLDPSCNNGVQDGPESDIDCGGSEIPNFCTPCEPDERCRDDSDCESFGCLGGTCVSWVDVVHRIEIRTEKGVSRRVVEWKNRSPRADYSVDGAYDACLHLLNAGGNILGDRNPGEEFGGADPLGRCEVPQQFASPVVRYIPNEGDLYVEFTTEYNTTGAGAVRVLLDGIEEPIASGNYY